MRYLISLSLIIFIGTSTHAQLDSLSKDSLVVMMKSKKELLPYGIVLSGQVKSVPNFGSYEKNYTLSAGGYWKKIQVNFQYQFYTNAYTKILIFPNQSVLRYINGGIHVNYNFLTKQKHELSLGWYGGKGDILWEDVETFFNYFNDRYVLLEPEVNYKYNRLRYLVPKVAIGYRKWIDLTLPGVSARQLDGFFISVGLETRLTLKKRDEK